MSVQSSDKFPSHGLLPKEQTQALQFIEQHPMLDGRGVKVAILDTGVDPGAAGLQVTPDGLPKMVDCQDTTGSGDVDMTEEVKVDVDGSVTGISGKKLKLNPHWDNPTGVFRVGLKRAYEFFPSGLVSRMKKERKKKWTLKNNAKLTKARSRLEKFDRKNKTSPGSELKIETLWDRKELAARIEMLESEATNYSDAGPAFDCVAFQDGTGQWRGAIDKNQDGNLSNANAMANFAVAQEFERLDDESLLNYCINIYDEGNVLSICVDSGAHGTHVAAIVASYTPGQPEMNGVAPGAQIMSFKVGDGRMDAMETGTGIIRALNACVTAGADVINLSFGEPTKIPDGGRISELVREIVHKRGIIFVSSAGNSGPALSTVGAPGSTTQGLIGVGAHVNPSMMKAEYSMRKDIITNANNYTWSSRGPSYDGQLGVSISAPGGAITSVPNWTLQKKRLMNGTSMASPNAAGGVALILSGLKSMDVWYSPQRVHRALESTAKKIEGVEPHALGHGLIQVKDAYEAAKFGAISKKNLSKKDNLWILDIPFKITVNKQRVTSGSGFASGIYLREPYEVLEAKEFDITVQPLFVPDSDDPATGDRLIRYNKQDRTEIDLHIELVSTVEWAKPPEHVHMNALGRAFKVWVDPTAIAVNGVAFGEILGYDPRVPKTVGPLFRIPISIIKPMNCNPLHAKGKSSSVSVNPSASLGRLRFDPTVRFPALEFTPGKIVRKFIAVPPGATWATVKLNANLEKEISYNGDDQNAPGASRRVFYLHCLQIRNHSCYREDESKSAVEIRQAANATVTKEFPVVGGGTVEVCIAQFWSSPGSGHLDVEVNFAGLTVSPSQISLDPTNGLLSQVNLQADLCPIKVESSGSLKSWSKVIAPLSDETRLVAQPLEARDAILGFEPASERPTYQLELTFEFDQAEEDKLKIRAPLLNDLLYDSPLDAQMSMLFSQDKELIHTGDAWPQDFTCPAGKHKVRFCIRHEKKEMLDPLKNMNIVLERKLKSVSLSFFNTKAGPLLPSNTDKFKNRVLGLGRSCPVFVGCQNWPAISTKLPKAVSPGDVLSGTITFSKSSPNKYPVSFVVPCNVAGAPKEISAKSSTESEKESVQNKWKIDFAKARLKLLQGLGLEAKEKLVSDDVFSDHYGATKELIDSLLDGKVGEELYVQLLRTLFERKCAVYGKATEKDAVEESKNTLLETCKDVIDALNGSKIRTELNDVKARLSSVSALNQLDDSKSLNETKDRLEASQLLLLDTLKVKTYLLFENNTNDKSRSDDKLWLSAAEIELDRLGEWATAKDVDFKYLCAKRWVAREKFAMGYNILKGIKFTSKTKSTLGMLLSGKQEFNRKSLFMEMKSLVNSLGYSHLQKYYHDLELKKYPKEYPPF